MSQDYPTTRPPKRPKPGAIRYGLDLAAWSWLSDLRGEDRSALSRDRSTFGISAGFLALAEEALHRALDEIESR